MTTFCAPSTISSSFSRISARALCVATTAGHVEAARDDRRVRGDAAEVGEERGEVVLLELDHVRRRQVVRDEDGLLLGAGGAHRLPACRAAPSARARPPAPRRPCARAGRDPRSARTARPAPPSAASAPIRRCSAARRSSASGASDSVGSVRIIQCTSRNAPNSAGASPESSRLQRFELLLHRLAAPAPARDLRRRPARRAIV